MQTEENSNDLLSLENYLVRAETGKRFLNYMIDVIVFYILVFAVGVVLAVLSPAIAQSFAEGESNSFNLLDRLLALLFYAIYMSIVEGLFKGKSLGKLITRTRAVNMDGSRISWTTAFARGFSRAVPFCVFSAFGSPCDPWQDRWTDTMVIDEKNSQLNNSITS
jgi:uncharacterized RDD family membrane protein YckC